MPPLRQDAMVLLLCFFAVTAAWMDLRLRIVPNRLVSSCLVCGIVLAAAGGAGCLWEHSLGLVLGFGLLLPAFLFSMVGGGDVKSLTVVGLLAGPHMLWMCFLRGTAAAGLVALIVIASRLLGKRGEAAAPATEGGEAAATGKSTIPYAGILCLTLLLTMVSGLEY